MVRIYPVAHVGIFRLTVACLTTVNSIGQTEGAMPRCDGCTDVIAMFDSFPSLSSGGPMVMSENKSAASKITTPPAAYSCARTQILPY